jgi:hypothetical protein
MSGQEDVYVMIVKDDHNHIVAAIAVATPKSKTLLADGVLDIDRLRQSYPLPVTGSPKK